MNAIAFGTKRAFHSFLRVTRKPFFALGITAARFDMMSTLVVPGRGVHVRFIIRRQSSLRRSLGVSAPVVSRMIRALVSLGLVVRELDPSDLRQLVVRLTPLGQRCIQHARHLLLRAVQRLVYKAICFAKNPDAAVRFQSMSDLESLLSGLRSYFFDTASLYYPWGHPDD